MNRKIRKLKQVLLILLGIFSNSILYAQVPDSCTFVEDNGILTVEMESANLASTFWIKENDVPGYTGSGFIQYVGGNEVGVPGISVISYTFRITTPGRYSFKLRGWRSTYSDNDVWVRFPQGGVITKIDDDSTGTKGNNWFKALIGPRDEWYYFAKTQNLETSGEKFHDVYVDFPSAGVYTVEFSGRSTGFRIDRFTLYNTSGFVGMDISNTESSKENCLPYSNSTSNPFISNNIPNQSTGCNATWSFTVPANTFTHPGGLTLYYICYESGVYPLPSWMTFNPSNQTFTGNPTFNDGGDYNIIVKSQRGTEYVIDVFRISVTGGNTPPIVTNELPDSNAIVGENFQYAIPANTFFDADGNSLTYTITANNIALLPAWLMYLPVQKTLIGTPSLTDVGIDTIYVTANDGYGGQVTDMFFINVKEFSVSGTKSSIATMKANVYPNPADQFVNIKVNEIGKGSITLSDNLGRIYYSNENQDLGKEILIDLESFNINSGLYIFRIKADSGREYNGMVVKK